MIRLLHPSEVEGEWEKLAPALSKAIRRDPRRTAMDVYRGIVEGTLALFTVSLETVNGVMVVEIHEIDGSKCLSLIYFAGRIGPHPPRQWTSRVREMVSTFLAAIAKAASCTEIRIEGRDWSRVFPDWEVLDADRHALRLRLA